MWVREACAGMRTFTQPVSCTAISSPRTCSSTGRGRARCKVLDFGISKISGDGRRMAMTSTSLGSPAYMSPEQVR